MCKYCGVPKRGHVCTVPKGTAVSGGGKKAKKEKAEKALAKQDSDTTQPSDGSAETWDPKSIFQDIKSVLPKTEAGGEKKSKKSSGTKRSRKEEGEGEGSSEPLECLSIAAEQAQKLQQDREMSQDKLKQLQSMSALPSRLDTVSSEVAQGNVVSS